LLASPGPRRGRELVTWRHWAVLVPAAVFVQVSALLLDASYLRVFLELMDLSGYLILSAVLAAVTVGLAVTLKLNRTFLLLIAAMFYPYAMQLACSPILRPSDSDTSLLFQPTPGNLAVLFGPPLLLACGILLTAIRPRRRRVVISAGRQA
jgi:GR25 family glycosyltransferase involved in LPS biosynthesis